ncbi:MAG: hypothetical protein ACFE94_13075 [Candidatus Hodarchaeota archaeon]
MPVFRADLYLRIKISDFDLVNSSEKFLEILEKSSWLRNIQMTKVRQDKELHGRMAINEWYEISGSIDVPEGSKSFWVLSKQFSQDEPYNFFVRIDRNIEAEDYDRAQKKAADWIKEILIESIKKEFLVDNIEVEPPINLRKQVYLMRESK